MAFPVIGGSQSGGYLIDNSLRFNDDDSPKLEASLSTPDSRRNLTVSFWIKRSNLPSATRNVWSVGTANGNVGVAIGFLNTHELYIYDYDGGTDYGYKIANRAFRDPSAWYHVLIAVDTTQGTASNRAKFYVNGVLQTTTATWGDFPQNHDLNVNANSNKHSIGTTPFSTVHWDGYLTEVNHIDGITKAHTDFGEFDEDSGIWKPIEYTGTYGTNGYYLDFENSGSLGADQSGNGNNFTPTNLASTDQTTDTPTNNFATLNPLSAFENDGTTYFNGNYTMEEGNTRAVSSGNAGAWGHSFSTIGMSSGKWYWEVRTNSISNSTHVGVSQLFVSGYFQNQTTSRNINLINGSSTGGAGAGAYNLSAFSAGDILMIALDMDNGEVYFGKNGTWGGSGNPATNTNPCFTGLDTTTEYFAGFDLAYTGSFSWNYGSPDFSISSGNSDGNGYGNFEYAPPSGYLALCTQNLATALSPTIDDGSQYFNTVLYTGNGSTNAITGVGFQPDWVWGKCRSAAQHHRLFDSSRGVLKNLISSATNAEATTANSLTSFDSDGFTLGSDDNLNFNTRTFVAWNWKANAGTTSSNTDGSITSTVQANTTAGFSIVTYTGTGANATVGHGLGKAPEWIMIKRRDATGEWIVYQKSFSEDGSGEFNLMNLNDTDATQEFGAFNFMQSTSPTSSVFYTDGQSEMNASGGTFVAYCFAEIEGYSKFGSYTANGNVDGPFVYTGFRPAWVMFKQSNSSDTAHWLIFDSKRSPTNVIGDDGLAANLNEAEGLSSWSPNTSDSVVDFVSNGFKVRTTATSGFNINGNTMIYMAFAENPFVTSGATPVTAR